MSWLTSQIIPSLQTLKILGDVEAFKSWIKTEHPSVDLDRLFEGYKFSLVCCLNCFIDGMTGDELLGIKNDFLLDRAIAELIPIHHVENTCEKTVFLKILKPYYKAITKANSYPELSESLNKFNENVTVKFDKILKSNIHFSRKTKLDKATGIKLLLIDYAHTYLVQINNNGPTANDLHPLSVNWTKTEKLNTYLNGYKYAIQFLWVKLIGENKFKKTRLKNMHQAQSWREYKYIEKEKPEESFIEVFNQEFKLEEQNSFDSYFYWIQREITDPLKRKYKFAVYTIDSYFQFSPKNYNKRELFGEFLNKANITQVPSGLNWEDRIKERLYWHGFEVIDTRKTQMHQGIPAFNTMLAGTVALHNRKSSQFSKVIVAKFTHPHSSNGKENDYSFGILIDSKSSAGHYYSGWVIYQNACGDYSGFSGREYRSSQNLISKYQKQYKIQLRELIIPLEEFISFTNKYTKTDRQLSILEQNKLIPDIIQKSRAYLFELFTFQVCTRFFNGNYRIHFSTEKNSDAGEKDVVIENNEEVILIECKLNPNNYDVSEIIQKADKKIRTHSQSKKTGQFWFWYPPSKEQMEILDRSAIFGNPIKVVVVSDPRAEKILKGIDLKQMRFIMQDYTNHGHTEYSDLISENS